MNPDTPYWSDAAVSSAEMMATYATMDNAFVIPEEHIVNWDQEAPLLKSVVNP